MNRLRGFIVAAVALLAVQGIALADVTCGNPPLAETTCSSFHYGDGQINLGNVILEALPPESRDSNGDGVIDQVRGAAWVNVDNNHQNGSRSAQITLGMKVGTVTYIIQGTPWQNSWGQSQTTNRNKRYTPWFSCPVAQAQEWETVITIQYAGQYPSDRTDAHTSIAISCQ